MRSQAIIVLGMHRSGTSALTGCLSLLGVELGSDLLLAHPERNAKGHWELREAVALNDRLLASLGYTWHDERALPANWQDSASAFLAEMKSLLQREFALTSLWGLKDPRLCRILPLWRQALPLEVKPYFILALRHPTEVANSLAQRDAIPTARAYLLWLVYMLEAELASRGCPRIVIDYEALLADWRTALSPLVYRLSLQIPLDDAERQKNIDAFLSPALRHFTSGAEVIPSGSWHQLAIDAYRAFSTHADDLSPVVFDELRHRMEEMVQQITPWATQIQELLGRIDSLEQELSRAADRDVLFAEVERIKSTVSWQITKPLRLIGNLLRGR